MYIRVDPNSGIPLGVQIVRGIRLAIANGKLVAGEQLPSARDLAAQLQVNFHTVRKAFGELEAEGLLELRRGRGTFVPARVRKLRAADVQRVVREHVDRLLEDLAGAGVDHDRLEELLRSELVRALSKKDERV